MPNSKRKLPSHYSRNNGRQALFTNPPQKRIAVILIVVAICCCFTAAAQAQFYTGAMGGIATLSGDASSLVATGESSFSNYSPHNGFVLDLLAGWHLSDYFSVQANYNWNRNNLTLTAGSFSNGMQQGYEETRNSSQQSFLGDVLVYFRKRGSRFRPYLSVGTGVVHFSSTQQQVTTTVGSPVLPPQTFSSTMVALHVPVGIDVRLHDGWAFRYAFSETLTSNPISDRLAPPGTANLKNFQNLFGIIKQF